MDFFKAAISMLFQPSCFENLMANVTDTITFLDYFSSGTTVVSGTSVGSGIIIVSGTVTKKSFESHG